MTKTSTHHFFAWFVLLLFLVTLGFAFQGRRGIWQPDEGYYSGVAETMLEKSCLMIPFLGEDDIFLDKPPLVYWSIIAGLKLFGHNEFGLRFLNGASFIFTALLSGLLGFSLFGDRKVGVLTVVIYATMIIPFFASNFVTPDTLLSLWTTASAVCFWKSIDSSDSQSRLWKLGVCISAGFGFLAKGPAVLIPFGGMFIFLLITKKAVKYFLNFYSVVCFCVFCLVGLSWYFWISMNVPGALSYIFDSEVWGRLISGRFERNPGLLGAGIYFAVLSGGSLPWSVIWLEKGRIRDSIFKKTWWYELKQRPEVLFLVCLFFVPLVVLCLASSKLGLYALPLFCPLSIATARQWSQRIDSTVAKRQGHWEFPVRWVVLAGLWSMILVCAKLGLAHYPSRNDMRALALELKKYAGTGNYEVCTISQRADGLLFYGIRELEHLTYKHDAYPTFSPTENIIEEINEMMEEKEEGFFLVPSDYKAQALRKLLLEAGVRTTIIEMSYGRRLMALRWGNDLINGDTSGKKTVEQTE